jgi:predicted nucleotide-binding protein (sugar kinase/HSP70/actin superfamily)
VASTGVRPRAHAAAAPAARPGEKIFTFPHMGNYEVPMRTLLRLLDFRALAPPQITKKTLELGAKYSPDFVCVPFKYNLGNYIEALDAGANVILQAGGGCRFGYYGEVQQQILRDLGYDFEFFHFVSEQVNVRSYYGEFKRVQPDLNLFKFQRAFRVAAAQLDVIDRLEEFMRLNIGFEVTPGSFEKLHAALLRELGKVSSVREVKRIEADYRAKFEALPIDKPANPLRVGVVGEIYVVMEPYSNYFIERELARKGIEVHRFITASYLFANNNTRHWAELVSDAGDYLKYFVADGTDSVAKAVQLQKQGFDGLIHVKPFGCMPEVNAMPSLQRLSKNEKFPIMYLSFDTQTSETGVKTRIEAFYDMIQMKRDGGV